MKKINSNSSYHVPKDAKVFDILDALTNIQWSNRFKFFATATIFLYIFLSSYIFSTILSSDSSMDNLMNLFLILAPLILVQLSNSLFKLFNYIDSKIIKTGNDFEYEEKLLSFFTTFTSGFSIIIIIVIYLEMNDQSTLFGLLTVFNIVFGLIGVLILIVLSLFSNYFIRIGRWFITIVVKHFNLFRYSNLDDNIYNLELNKNYIRQIENSIDQLTKKLSNLEKRMSKKSSKYSLKKNNITEELNNVKNKLNNIKQNKEV